MSGTVTDVLIAISRMVRKKYTNGYKIDPMPIQMREVMENFIPMKTKLLKSLIDANIAGKNGKKRLSVRNSSADNLSCI